MEEGGRGRFFFLAVPTLAATAIIAATAYEVTGNAVSSIHASTAISGAFCIVFAGFILNERQAGRGARIDIMALAAGYAPVLALSLVMIVAGWRHDLGEETMLNHG